MTLAITHLPLDAVHPNPWNPNRQTERQFEAETESILTNGFIAPIIVRPHPDEEGTYQIVDGEHRYRALVEIVDQQLDGARNIPTLVADRCIPAVVLDLDDANAKRLTVILNETRGSAVAADLGALLAEIQADFGDDLINGLPYTELELEQLVSMGEFDWDSVVAPTADDFDTGTSADTHRIVAEVDTRTWERWSDALELHELRQNDRADAGALIAQLLNQPDQPDA